MGMAPPMGTCVATQVLVPRSATRTRDEMSSSQKRRRGTRELTKRPPHEQAILAPPSNLRAPPLRLFSVARVGKHEPQMSVVSHPFRKEREKYGARSNCSLGILRGRGDFHFGEGGLAASADVLPDAVIGDFGHEVPAAGAFGAGGGRNHDTKSCADGFVYVKMRLREW